jgi:hypothetical protein
MSVINYVKTDTRQAVTHIRESRRFESMYTLQGKTWSTWHVRFPRQSTYATRMLPADGPNTWQHFTLTQQSWIDSLLSRKSASDSTSQPSWVARGTRLSFSPNTTIEAVRLSQTSVYEKATRLTGPISSACDQYIQYLLTGANPSVLNRHRQGLQPCRCQLATYHSPTFLTNGLHFSSKGPAWSQVIKINISL